MDGRLAEIDRHFHERIDAHRHASRLSDIILGGQDGLVNVLGVILGVAAATSEARIVLAAGMAATFAESVSMAAVAYTSTQARRALYQAEVEREHRHITAVPELEREEIRELYRKKGFEGPLLDQIVETITANRDVWVAVMVSDELKLAEVSKSSALKSAVTVGLSALGGSFVPILPFAFAPIGVAVPLAMAISGLVLFGAGAYKAKTTVGHWLRSGLEMTAIGILSALVGYGVGLLFKVPVA